MRTARMQLPLVLCLYFSICPLVLPRYVCGERAYCAPVRRRNVNGFDFRVTTVMDEDEQGDGAVPKADNMLRFLVANWAGAQVERPCELGISLPLHPYS